MVGVKSYFARVAEGSSCTDFPFKRTNTWDCLSGCAGDSAELASSRRDRWQTFPVCALGAQKSCGYRRSGSVLRIATSAGSNRCAEADPWRNARTKSVSIEDETTPTHTRVLECEEECARFTPMCAEFVLRGLWIKGVSRSRSNEASVRAHAASSLALRGYLSRQSRAEVLALTVKLRSHRTRLEIEIATHFQD
jgi:hypothetical protein